MVACFRTICFQSKVRGCGQFLFCHLQERFTLVVSLFFLSLMRLSFFLFNGQFGGLCGYSTGRSCWMAILVVRRPQSAVFSLFRWSATGGCSHFPTTPKMVTCVYSGYCTLRILRKKIQVAFRFHQSFTIMVNYTACYAPMMSSEVLVLLIK